MSTTDPTPDIPNARARARLAEATDAAAWLDEYAAAPPPLAAGLGLRAQAEDGLAMVRSVIPFSHFNMVLTLGCGAVADQAAFAAIERFYAGPQPTRHWVLVNDHSEPADLAAQLEARGYREDGGWDRVLLNGTPRERWHAAALGCEPVGAHNQQAWSDFIRGCYGMPPPIGDWLHALVGRPGWIHRLRREGGRADAPVVMVRSAFVTPAGGCWLGIDAPVPGVMAPCFDDDQRVTAALLLAAADAGAHHFVSDIEQTHPERRGPGYTAWAELGFEVAYRRRLYVKG